MPAQPDGINLHPGWRLQRRQAPSRHWHSPIVESPIQRSAPEAVTTVRLHGDTGLAQNLRPARPAPLPRTAHVARHSQPSPSEPNLRRARDHRQPVISHRGLTLGSQPLVAIAARSLMTPSRKRARRQKAFTDSTASRLTSSKASRRTVGSWPSRLLGLRLQHRCVRRRGVVTIACVTVNCDRDFCVRQDATARRETSRVVSRDVDARLSTGTRAPQQQQHFVPTDPDAETLPPPTVR